MLEYDLEYEPVPVVVPHKYFGLARGDGRIVRGKVRFGDDDIL